MRIILCIFILCLTFHTFSQNAYLNDLLKSTTPKTSVKKLLKQGINYQDFISDAQNREFYMHDTGVFEKAFLCSDRNTRYYYVYIPKTYKPENEHSLIVFLHGGVNSYYPGYKMSTDLSDSKFKVLADQTNSILLIPTADYKAPWWSRTAIDFIRKEIRCLLIDYNIDSDKIFLTGFSDGASGTMFLSMLMTEKFAGFIALSGSALFGTTESKIQVYPKNLSNSVIRITNTDKDDIFPASEMEPTARVLVKANDASEYVVYNNYTHNFNYSKEEIPKMIEFIKHNKRNSIPDSIYWECFDPEFGKFKWISIDKIGDQEKEEWHTDLNYQNQLNKTWLGFYGESNNTSKGLEIVMINKSSTFCKYFGLEKGDIITKINNTFISSFEAMQEEIDKVKEDEYVKTRFIHDTITFLANKKMIPFMEPPAFPRNQPSGAVKVSYCDNTFIFHTSSVSAVSLYINPQMVDLTRKVKVIINGENVFEEIVEPDVEFMIKNYVEEVDPECIYIKKLRFKI